MGRAIGAKLIIYVICERGRERKRERGKEGDLFWGETRWDAQPQVSLRHPVKPSAAVTFPTWGHHLKLTNPCPCPYLCPAPHPNGVTLWEHPSATLCSENKVFCFFFLCHLASIFHVCSALLWMHAPGHRHPFHRPPQDVAFVFLLCVFLCGLFCF